MDAGRLFQVIRELKRRRVFRATTVYVVGALAVLQATDVLAHALRIPEWSVTVVAALGLIGLPITILVAWHYELRPDGLHVAAGESSASPGSARPSLYLGIGFVMVLVGLVVYSRASGSGAGIRSIAVLPFADLSQHHDQEYFSDGITDEIRNALQKLPGLKVAPRSSTFAYKARKRDARAIGMELGVESLLEGSVRKSGGKLRITAELVDARTGYQLWSEKYDRQLADVFAVQEDIARSVVNAFDLQLSGRSRPRLVKRYTDNLDAYEPYLRGRFELEQVFMRTGPAGALKAIDHFKKAIAVDSAYALAWAAIAETYAQYLADNYWAPRDAYPKAREAAQRALALDPNLADAHLSLGLIKFWHDWDFAGAEAEFTRAIQLDSRNVPAYVYRARVRHSQGRFAEVLSDLNAGAVANPARSGIGWSRPLVFMRVRAGHGRMLADSLRAVIATDSTGRFEGRLAFVLFVDRQFDQLKEVRGRRRAREARQGQTVGSSGPAADARRPIDRVPSMVITALLGDRSEAEQGLNELRELEQKQYVAPDQIAELLAVLGRTEEAFLELDRAVAVRSAYLVDNSLDSPGFDSIRKDPRFIGIRKRLGLRPQIAPDPR